MITSSASYNPSIYPRRPQTHHYTTSVTNKLQRQGRTEEQTGNSLWDQLLRLPSSLHRRDWQKQIPKSSCLKKLREQAVCWFPVPLGLSWSFQLRLVENFQTNEGGKAVNGFILSDLERIYSLTLTWKT